MDRLADTLSGPGLRPTVGLVLTGGGSRSAYQVGVLLALAEMLPRSRNPFQVIVGTSAGAVARPIPPPIACCAPMGATTASSWWAMPP